MTTASIAPAIELAGYLVPGPEALRASAGPPRFDGRLLLGHRGYGACMADEEITEPENSTVDDWFGQSVARDAELADEISADEPDEKAAERRFDREADGQERYEAGHPRP